MCVRESEIDDKIQEQEHSIIETCLSISYSYRSWLVRERELIKFTRLLLLQHITYRCSWRDIDHLGASSALGNRGGLQVGISYRHDADDLHNDVGNSQPVHYEGIFTVKLARQEHDGEHHKHFIKFDHDEGVTSFRSGSQSLFRCLCVGQQEQQTRAGGSGKQAEFDPFDY